MWNPAGFISAHRFNVTLIDALGLLPHRLKNANGLGRRSVAP